MTTVHEIKTLSEKKLIGMKSTMSFANNTTSMLWRSFMPRRKEIANQAGIELYSLQIYSAGFFEGFNPDKAFEKWAAVEVKALEIIPAGMKPFILESGLYAVFYHKGTSSNAQLYEYIFSTWLPASDYILDRRPHFEVLGKEYKNKDHNSDEEIWIPVRKK